MKPRKLYNVEVTYKTVVFAESKEAAQREAECVIRYEDVPADVIYSSEIKSISDVETPWEGSCIPWGDQENDSYSTIKEILDQQSPS
jgi:hypothetical protein